MVSLVADAAQMVTDSQRSGAMNKLLLILCIFTGTAFAQHSVTVTWTASPDAAANPTLTYNVYRATSACTGNPAFSKVDATAAGILTFTDTAVSVGQTLCYQVTSLLNGLESVPSNTAQAVILPQAPSNVVATPK